MQRRPYQTECWPLRWRRRTLKSAGFRTCRRIWRASCCLMPWRPDRSDADLDSSRSQKSSEAASAVPKLQPPVRTGAPPAEPERRGEPVEISAFLHVAQQVSTDEHPQPDTGSAAGCLATCRGTRSAVTALHHWVDQLVSTLPKEAVRRCQRRSGARWWCSPRRAATG
jgi:hypothetical protein